MQAKITKRLLDSLAVTERTYLFDTEVKGFLAILYPGGEITFAVQYRAPPGGRTAPKRRYKLGVLGTDLTIDEGRREAQRVLGLVRAGADPAAEKADARTRAKTTVASLVDSYVELRLKPRLRTWAAVEAALRKLMPELGGMDIGDVDRRAIARALDEAAKRGPIAANRSHAYLSGFFRWAVERGHIDTSPLADVRRPSDETSRERVLGDGELVAVWRAAEGMGHPWRPLLHLLILTGQRRSEIAEMTWTEIEGLDVDRPLWRIPAERSKNRREHTIPLPKSAVEILKEIPRTGPLVFTTTGTTPVSGFGKMKQRLDKIIAEAGQKDAADSGVEYRPMREWIIHDLRRSCASGLGRLGFAPHSIEAVLNHISGTRGGIAGVYNRHGYEREIEQALAAWDAHLAALLKGEEQAPSNIVKLRRQGVES